MGTSLDNISKGNIMKIYISRRIMGFLELPKMLALYVSYYLSQITFHLGYILFQHYLVIF